MSLFHPIAASYPALEDKLQALRAPATYPGAAGAIDAIETHCAWVFFTDQYAYKLKKPMLLDRMDHRLLAARERSCREELRLNQRLAAEVYLEVLPLNLTDSGALSLHARGTPVEWLVKMRRLPRALMLDQAIRAGTATAALIRPVAERLAQFYACQPSIGMPPTAYVERLRLQIEASRRTLLAQDLKLPADAVDRVSLRQHEFLQDGMPLLMERARRGRILEGHGDLKPEHLYLGDPPCVIDCVEFDRDLRLLDPLEELAFFSLECDRLGVAWIGEEMTAAYAARSGDRVDPVLFSFYASRRASQRAISCAWHLRDPRSRGAGDWTVRALSYLEMALRLLEAAASKPAELGQ